jgi:hypothetical protein
MSTPYGLELTAIPTVTARVTAQAAAFLALLNTLVGIKGGSIDQSSEKSREEQEGRYFEGNHFVMSCKRGL